MAREDSISKHIGEIIVPQQFRPECSVRCGARDLAFELAGKINAELQALDWVTSPQRVTTADPAGWAAFAQRSAELAAELSG